MTRPHYGFGGIRHQCPVCGERMGQGEYRRMGAFSVHTRCHPSCAICGQEVEPPAIGKNYTVVAWLGQPAHLSCKEKKK